MLMHSTSTEEDREPLKCQEFFGIVRWMFEVSSLRRMVSRGGSVIHSNCFAAGPVWASERGRLLVSRHTYCVVTRTIDDNLGLS